MPCLRSIPVHRPRAGFTLIELLTVIAIIGVLAAILIPVVGRVRESGRKATCSSNLRQLSMAFLLYADERKRFPGVEFYDDGRLTNWIIELVAGGYIGVRVAAGDSPDKVWICPSARGSYPPVNPGQDNTYGANGVALGSRAAAGTAISLSRVSSPARTALLTDGFWQGAAFSVGTNPQTEFPTPVHPVGPGSSVNVVFMDGHVESRRVSDLPTDPANMFWRGRD